MNIETALTSATAKLLGMSDSPRLDAELLLMFVLDEPRSHLHVHADRELHRDESDRYTALVIRRTDGEPIAYITGEKEFWSLPLTVTAETLVPRPETELLVELALTHIPEGSTLRILDLGTGSGAIALAIASERPRCRVVATDISESALRVAVGNAGRLKLTNVTFLQGDWLAPFSDCAFDIIVSNPPYVAATDSKILEISHEPAGALFAGEDGLASIRTIAADAGTFLVDNGMLLLEHGAEQEQSVARVLAANGWDGVLCRRDLQGLPRVTIAIRGIGSWRTNSVCG